jgi:hypothetical protein
MMKSLSISEAIEKSNDARTLIEHEKGNLAMRGNLTHLERVRIFLNRWWVFALLALAVSQLVQTLIAVLKYFE